MGKFIVSDQRASLTVDFILSMFILLVLAVSILGTIHVRLETVHDAEEVVQARLISEKIASAIEDVYSAGEGYEMRIEMPSNIAGYQYQVRVNQSGVKVEIGGWSGYSYSFSKKIAGYNLNQSRVIMRPNTNYTIRNLKQGKHNLVMIYY